MSIIIRDVPLQERPRERFLREGAKALSNQEILAIMLRTGTKHYSALHVASTLLSTYKTLTALSEASLEEMKLVKGIGETKAIELSAAIELGKRILREGKGEKRVVSSPDDAVQLVVDDLVGIHQEHFVVLYLNTKNYVIKQKTVFIGSLNASIVHPREVFKEALRTSSAAVICLHNHPSGDPSPSPEDISVTKRLYEAGKILGITLLDHIIIGDEANFISLKERGFISM
ncbi:DNA repair protein RadC [Shouchella sp. JSM 1781072]|uniref:RadC family protein n=1 Tax=Bacillaceae TaxID=186817 RepID=UPI000C081BD9|nr:MULTISPECIES: DNA repair protein RadC [Bacillaceae]UTR05094.1 DNA repair protein RadC [Alkalihalobacillus sp. LMS6]